MKVWYTAAHSGFDLQRVPLGGAATICQQLCKAWQSPGSPAVQLLSPSLLGPQAPQDKDLVHYSELRYARFCFAFEKALTEEILKSPPGEGVVLSNDISEGPDFKRLADKGYRVFTIYHVDVVDYFTRMYLRRALSPEAMVRLYQSLEASPARALLPSVLKLVFQKQRDSVRYSRGIIVPSEGMKRMILSCYPETPDERIHVVPWGNPVEQWDSAAVDRRAAELRRFYGIPEAGHVLLTLSRISPEKGQDRLLRALEIWERRQLPPGGLWVFICGEAAYMQGRRFRRKLGRMAQRLKNVSVIFPGFLSGVDKQAYLSLADLYVFPSRHESYGLTLLEAFRAGLPAVVCDHYGAEETFKPDFGELVSSSKETDLPALLQQTLEKLLSDPIRLKVMGQNARAYVLDQPFSKAASRLAEILKN
jgi:glycosyltransferase involved in cell wall biosynthesis